MKAWEHPDLERISVATSFEASEEVYQALSLALSDVRDRRKDVHVHTVGAAEHDGYMVFANLSLSTHPTGEGSYHCLLDLGYTLRPFRSIPARRRSALKRRFEAIAAALGSIGSLPGECDLRCSITWGYEIEAVSPVIQLPMFRLNASSTRFRQISGVRFTTDDDNSNDFVTLDRLTESHWHLATNFEVSRGWSSEIVERVIIEANNLRAAFTIEPEISGEEAQND